MDQNQSVHQETSLSDDNTIRKVPVVLLIVFDILYAAMILLAFYLTTYSWHSEIKPQSLAAPSAAPIVSEIALESAAPPASQAPEEASPSQEPLTLREKFADKFTDGSIKKTANSYKSANISVTIDTVQKDGVTYYLADIYVADIKYFKTAFAKEADVLKHEEPTDKIAKEVGAILAINGDSCIDNHGLIIRNGSLYPTEETEADVLMMYRDGTMVTLSPEDADRDKIVAEAPYQVWSFGPMLLKDGQAMTEFNSPNHIAGSAENPRTAIGYYEPGHYCFLVVDGRQKGYSYPGMSCSQLSALFQQLGCKAAYNLDGGKTSEMAFMGELYNKPVGGGRSVSDIVYIADE